MVYEIKYCTKWYERMLRLQSCFTCYLMVVALALLISYGRGGAIVASYSVKHNAYIISELAKPWNLLGNAFGVSVSNLNLPPFIRDILKESEEKQ